MVKESFHSIKNLFFECEKVRNSSTINDDCVCNLRNRMTAYADVAIDVIRLAKRKYTPCHGPRPPALQEKKRHQPPMDCLDFLQRGHNASGVYTIQLNATNQTQDVFCDMETEGGGWTLIQRRGDYLENLSFFKSWESYKKGFGNMTKDFWIGNENIHLLSQQGGEHSARFDMEDEDGERRFARYDFFKVDGEEENYKLHIYNYEGDAGNAMDAHNQMEFSTFDKRNDKRAAIQQSCATMSESGWWFNDCSATNPNGVYAPGKEDNEFKYMFWWPWKKHECLDSMEIKIRRKNSN